jgi:hypothetical protein
MKREKGRPAYLTPWEEKEFEMYATAKAGKTDLVKHGALTGVSGAAAVGLVAASRLQNHYREFCDSLVAAVIGAS